MSCLGMVCREVVPAVGHLPASSPRPGLLTVADLHALAREANTEHELVEQALDSALDHAIRAGELLLQVKNALAGARGYREWAKVNLTFSPNTGTAYMRLAAYKDHVASCQSIREAKTYIRGLPQLMRGRATTKAEESEALRLRQSGLSVANTAALLGVSVMSVRLADPKYRKQVVLRNRQAQARRREATRALVARQASTERQAIGRVARSAHSGAIGAAYSAVRRTLGALDRAIAEADDTETAHLLRLAMSNAHRAEDDIIKALKVQRIVS